MYVRVIQIFINIAFCVLPKLRYSHTYTDNDQTGSQTSDIRHIHTQTKIKQAHIHQTSDTYIRRQRSDRLTYIRHQTSDTYIYRQRSDLMKMIHTLLH